MHRLLDLYILWLYLDLFCISFFREFGTQTLADNHTNVPKPQVFLGGLRGGGMSKPTVFTKVDLTLDVEEN